jgi:hypothetical protein
MPTFKYLSDKKVFALTATQVSCKFQGFLLRSRIALGLRVSKLEFGSVQKINLSGDELSAFFGFLLARDGVKHLVVDLIMEIFVELKDLRH